MERAVYFLRQLDIVDPDSLPSVCLIGCGGVGSAVALFLAKMGVKEFTLYDHDSVEHHNLNNSILFTRDSIGKQKVDVVAEAIRTYSPFSDVEVIPVPNKFGSASPLALDVVVSSVDSMESRRYIWEAMKIAMPRLYIDTRMGGESTRVYSLDPLDGSAISYYEASLKQSDFAEPCTAQAVAYNVGMIAMIVGSTVARFSRGESVDRLVIGDTRNLCLWKI